MDLELLDQAEDIADIRHRVRQLRWFKTTFRQQAKLIAQRYQIAYDIDDGRLTEAFLNWAEAFSRHLEFSDLDRRDFVTFAAGLLVRELLRSAPARATAPQKGASSDAVIHATSAIARSWPEGFLYTNYCLCVVHIVLEQDGVTLSLPAIADDLRTWWSFRENVGDDPRLAIPFLDLLIGNEPNWYFPDSIDKRKAMRRAIERGVVPRALASDARP